MKKSIALVAVIILTAPVFANASILSDVIASMKNQDPITHKPTNPVYTPQQVAERTPDNTYVYDEQTVENTEQIAKLKELVRQLTLILQQLIALKTSGTASTSPSSI